MVQTIFEVLYFPGIIKILTLLIMRSRHPEISIGIVQPSTELTHMITIKIETIQLSNRWADSMTSGKEKRQRDIILNLYGHCCAPALRSKFDRAVVDVEYDLLAKVGEVRVKLPTE